MGWMFRCDPSYDKKALVSDRIRTQSNGDTTWTVLAHSLRGNHLWKVVEVTKAGEPFAKFLALDLLQSGGRGQGWGYKDIDESMGPCETDCPLKFLDMVPETDSHYAKEWRAKVRILHERKRKAPKPGSTLKFAREYTFGPGRAYDTFTLTTYQSRGKERQCLKAPDGFLCRIRGWKEQDYTVISQ